MELNKDTRVTYLSDPVNDERVMTLVYTLIDDTVSFAFAINRPTEWVNRQSDPDYHVIVKVPGDQFQKSRGREIALGRLATKPTSVAVNGRKPVIAVLEALTEHKSAIVRDIVEAALYYRRNREDIEKMKAQLMERILAPLMNGQWTDEEMPMNSPVRDEEATDEHLN